MPELWTINRIAREYDVDPKTAHYWTTRDWFPEPVQKPEGRGHAALYDSTQVRAARRRYLANQRRRRARRERTKR